MRLAGNGWLSMSPSIALNGSKANPWLLGVILHIPDTNPSLFPELAFDSIFKCLAGFNEARQGGIGIRWELFLYLSRD
jgi:hypothetical protein